MGMQNTISLQEVRRDPLAFLRQINEGKTLVVIYHSKPYATVTSANADIIYQQKSTKRMLAYAKLARDTAKTTLDPAKSYKELYADDVGKKYDIS